MKLLDLQRDPAAFRQSLLIDTDSGPRPFAECMDPWQREDFEALDDGWQRAVIGSKYNAQFQRGWLERARGHSKSLDLAVMATWALFASRRRLSGIAAAGDLDQARLLRDAVGKLVYLNPWLQKLIEVQNYRVLNVHTESTLEIISSDAPTAYGLTPDFLVIDELTHWQKRDLWDSLISSAAKRSTCIVTVITNAGMMDDWQWTTREAIRNDPKWLFSRLEGSVASWISADTLEEQNRLLPEIAFRRLWLNEWSSGGGDALSESDIAAAFRDDLASMNGRENGWSFVAGVDLGLVRDSSAVVVLAAEQGRASRIRLAHHKVWRPTAGTKIDLSEVEQHILELDQQYGLEFVSVDPWQAEHLAQRLEVDSGHRSRNRKRNYYLQPWIRSVAPTGSNLREQASTLIESFRDRRLQLYDCEPLRRDLLKLRCEEKSYGYRLVSPRDGDGHGDSASAFALALLLAHELAGKQLLKIKFGMDTSDDDWLERFEKRRAEYQRDNEYNEADRQADRRDRIYGALAQQLYRQ